MRYLIFLALLILGCSSKPDIPKWYLNTPKDNSLYLYGSGEGYDRNEAINSALSFIGSKLKVKISSTFQSEKSYIDYNGKEDVYKNMSQNIKSTIDNFTFYNYQIDKIKKIDDKYYALIKINRQTNAQKIIQDIKNSLKNLPALTNSAIENLKNAKKAQKTIIKLKNRYKLAKILNPQIQNINFPKKYEKIIRNTTFNVYSNSTFLKNYLLNTISKKYTISNSPKIKVIANIYLKTKKIVGEYLTNAKLNLLLKDKTTQKEYFFECAASSFNPELSKKLAIKKCADKAKKLLNTLF